MSVLSLLWLVSRRKRVSKANKADVSVNPKLILLTALVPLFGTGCSVLNKPASTELAGESPGMSQQWYAAAGVDVSRMKPDTIGVPGVGVDDQVDSDVQLNEALSYRRAQTVVSYLTAQGIGAERTRIKALGETQPVQSNATAYRASEQQARGI